MYAIKNKLIRILEYCQNRKVRIWLFILLCFIVSKACTTITILSIRYLITQPFDTIIMLFPYMILIFFVHFCFWSCFLLLSIRSRLVAYFLLPFTIILQAAINFAIFTYQVECKEMAIAVINTTTAEAGLYSNDLLTSRLPFVVIAAFLVPILARALLNFPVSRKTRYTQLLVGLIGSVTFLSLPQIVKKYWIKGAMESIGFIDTMNPEMRTFPLPRSRESVLKDAVLYGIQNGSDYDRHYQPINGVIDCYSAIYKFYNPLLLKNAEDEPSEILWEKLPQTIVLYVGESTRADHFKLNGYHRDTMPGIIQEKNLINLPNLHSLKTHTIASIYAMLTLNPPDGGEATHNSFLGILKKNGYKLNLLVGANTEGMWYNTPTIGSLLSRRMTLHSRPKNATEYANAMREIQSKEHNHFIMIEDGAGHAPFHSESEVKPFGEVRRLTAMIMPL